MTRGYRPARDIATRLWERVDRSGECWIWLGARSAGRYGEMIVGSRSDGTRRLVKTHRLAYELEVGPIPTDSQLHHRCGNGLCVRPAHLELVTPREHMLRHDGPTAINARKTHCPKCGRPFAGDNLLMETGRRCKHCRYAYMSALKRRLRRERPWLPSARNVSEAGRVLAKSKGER